MTIAITLLVIAILFVALALCGLVGLSTTRPRIMKLVMEQLSIALTLLVVVLCLVIRNS